jgi:hypothetical protein
MEAPAELRARFGHPPERPVATVDGVPVPGARMSVTGQTFGDFRRAEGIPRAEYVVELPLAYLREAMEAEHASYVEDATAFPDPSDPLEQGLRERGWPAPAAVLDDPALLPLALELHAHDLLVRWLGDGQPAELPGWVAHSVTRRERAGERVLIVGVALAAGR